MIAVIISAAGVSLSMLYRAELDQKADLLRELAQSEARLIKTVIAAHAVDLGPSETPEKSLARLVDGLAWRLPKAEFGDSGEFILARRQGNQIVLSRRSEPFLPGPNLVIPMQSELAGPARLGLLGQSGIVRVQGYAEVKVLAAHHPVPSYDLAVVVKIDLSEVQGPFLIVAVVISGGIVVFLILVIGGWYFISLSMAQWERTATELGRSQEQLIRGPKHSPVGWLAIQFPDR